MKMSLLPIIIAYIVLSSPTYCVSPTQANRIIASIKQDIETGRFDIAEGKIKEIDHIMQGKIATDLKQQIATARNKQSVQSANAQKLKSDLIRAQLPDSMKNQRPGVEVSLEQKTIPTASEHIPQIPTPPSFSIPKAPTAPSALPPHSTTERSLITGKNTLESSKTLLEQGTTQQQLTAKTNAYLEQADKNTSIREQDEKKPPVPSSAKPSIIQANQNSAVTDLSQTPIAPNAPSAPTDFPSIPTPLKPTKKPTSTPSKPSSTPSARDAAAKELAEKLKKRKEQADRASFTGIGTESAARQQTTPMQAPTEDQKKSAQALAEGLARIRPQVADDNDEDND